MTNNMGVEIPKFVKWAGGKGQLLSQFEPLFPTKFERYIEPFVGGGAVFFHIVQKYKPKKIILSDINEELINTYKIVKTDVERLIVELKQHKEYHLAEGKKYYLTIRATNPKDLPPLERAARFIYLNKTCFNGLYRVNSKGQFNVPMGAYKNPDIVQEERLRIVSKLLKNVTLKVMSFEKVVALAKKGDFIYFDPPYYPLKNKKSFTTYTKEDFLEKEQELLAEVFKKLDKKKCFVMLSNSNTKFIKDLYKKFKIKLVKATRMINCDGKNRGKINEVVVMNY
ncbi:MAG: DNA adenine methylase [Candidatus Woesearchaeota archaeon]